MKNKFLKTTLFFSITTSVLTTPFDLSASEKKSQPTNIIASIIGTVGGRIQEFMGAAFNNKTRTAASLLTLNVIYRHHHTIHNTAKDLIGKIYSNQTFAKIAKGFAAAPFAYLAGAATDNLLTKGGKKFGINIPSNVSSFGTNYITHLIFNAFTGGTKMSQQSEEDKQAEQVKQIIQGAKVSQGKGAGNGEDPVFSDSSTDQACKMLLFTPEGQTASIYIGGRSGTGKSHTIEDVKKYADKDTLIITFPSTQSLVEWGWLGQGKHIAPELKSYIEDQKRRNGCKKVIVTFDETDRALKESPGEQHALERNKTMIDILGTFGMEGYNALAIGNAYPLELYIPLYNRFSGNHDSNGKIVIKEMLQTGAALQNSVEYMLKTGASKNHVQIIDPKAAQHVSSLFTGCHMGNVSKAIPQIMAKHKKLGICFDTTQKGTQAILFEQFLENADVELETNKTEFNDIQKKVSQGILSKEQGEKIIGYLKTEQLCIEKNKAILQKNCQEIITNKELAQADILPETMGDSLKDINSITLSSAYTEAFVQQKILTNTVLAKANNMANAAWWHALSHGYNPNENHDQRVVQYLEKLKNNQTPLIGETGSYKAYQQAKDAILQAQQIKKETSELADFVSKNIDPVTWLERIGAATASIRVLFSPHNRTTLDEIQDELAPYVPHTKARMLLANKILADTKNPDSYHIQVAKKIGSYLLDKTVYKITTDEITQHLSIFIEVKVKAENKNNIATQISNNIIHKATDREKIALFLEEQEKGYSLDLKSFGKYVASCPPKIAQNHSHLFKDFSWTLDIAPQLPKEESSKIENNKEKKVVDKKISVNFNGITANNKEKIKVNIVETTYQKEFDALGTIMRNASRFNKE